MTSAAVRLRCFGPITLERDGVALLGRATQRRRLAILTILAASPGRPVSRDKLMAYLWPEADEASARHQLSTSVYELRRALGEGAILSRGYDLLLDPITVDTDTAAFERAVAAEDYDSAVEFYRGDFADGFHVASAPEYEAWLEDQRAAYRRTYREMLLAHAAARGASGDADATTAAWMRVINDDRGDATVVLKALEALAAAGNPSQALRQANLHIAYLRRELGAEPTPEIVGFVEKLRTNIGQSTARYDWVETAIAVGANRHRRAPWLVATAGAMAIVATVSLGTVRSEPTDALEPGAARVLVYPFAAASPATTQDAVADLVSAGLDGAGSLRSVRPDAVRSWLKQNRMKDSSARDAATHFNASHYVVGRVDELSGRLQLRATLYQRVDGSPLASANAVGDAAQLFELVDKVVAQLIAASPAAAKGRLPRVAALTTHSVPALKAYLQGERDLTAGRYAVAAEAFQSAVAIDSTFALAFYRLSMATLAADLPGADAATADERALRHSTRLSEHDRLLVQAYLAFRQGKPDIAERYYRSLVNVYPDDAEAWSQLGETYFHYNPMRGRPLSEAREPFERALAFHADDWQALWHLAQIAASDGRQADALALLDRLLALRPAKVQALEVRTLRAVAARDRAAEAKLQPELQRDDDLHLHDLVWRAAVYLGDIDAAERLARILTGTDRPSHSQWIGRQDLAHLYIARGKWRAAEHELRVAARLSGMELNEGAQIASLLAIAWPPRSVEQLEKMRAELEEAIPTDAYGRRQRAFAIGLLESTLSRPASVTNQVAAEVAALEVPPEDPMAGLATLYAHTIRARAALSADDPRAALQHLDKTAFRRWFGHAASSLAHSQTPQRFTRAEALYRAGKFDEALHWYATFGEYTMYDLIYLAPSHMRRGQIAERAGKRDQAVKHYTRFLELWRDCDPELRPLVTSVQHSVKALTAPKQLN